MTTKSTKLRKPGLIEKLIAGIGGSIFLFVLGLLFLPLAPVFWFFAIGLPFAFMGVRYNGTCPVCLKNQDIRQKTGGFRCRRCKSILLIEGRNLVSR